MAGVRPCVGGILRTRSSAPARKNTKTATNLICIAVLYGPDDAVLADSVGLALLVVLESLGPSERLAFVLHDLFAVPFDEMGRRDRIF